MTFSTVVLRSAAPEYRNIRNEFMFTHDPVKCGHGFRGDISDVRQRHEIIFPLARFVVLRG